MLSRFHSSHRPRIWWSYPVLFIVATLLVSGCGAEYPRVHRVGIFAGGGPFADITDGFKAAMTDLGYTEGRNIEYIAQAATSNPDEDRHRLQFLLDEEVDLIFTFPTGSAILAKEVTAGTGMPVVFAYSGIEGNNLVESVRQPGGNITGVRFPGPEQTSRRLELLLEIAPQVKRVWIGYDKNSSNAGPSLEALHQFVASHPVTLVEVPATTIAELEADLNARAKNADLGLDAIILMPDGLSTNGWGMLNAFAAKHHIPIGGSLRHTVEQGALFGNASNFFEVGKQAAPLADKILQGTPAGTIPVVTPDQQLWINYRVAEELGLTVPEGLLKTADGIIR